MVANIIKLGWKNVWRNRTRSAVVIIAVVLGTWAGIFLSGLFVGLTQGYLDNHLKLSVPHIEIIEPQFNDLYSPQYYIPNSEVVLNELQKMTFIKKIDAESMTNGLVQSSRNSYGASIHGIRADTAHVIEQYILDGSMPGLSQERNPVLLGQKLAGRLSIEMGSRIVLSFQDVEGEITGGAFRVAGIFDTFSDPYDETNVFVKRDDLNRLLGLSNQIHDIKLTVDDISEAQNYTEQLKKQFPDLMIQSWGELAPELRMMFNMMDVTMYIVMIIVIIALVFSIINSMLMAVLERTRELGMLRAIGMNKSRVFSMIVWETLFLTVVGTPVGLFLSWFTISYFEINGINLTAFASAMNSYGFGTTIYPSLPPVYYLNITLLIALAALLSALYPAWKTLQLNPVEAIRKFN
jgi:ABC-type lipoprotein release transport system permease subunit